jgi:membrane-associated phospholipid phosphatase
MKPSVYFLIFFSGYLFTGAYCLTFVPKGDEIYTLSALHTPVTDFFFKYFTHLGDGIAAVIIAAILFVFRFYDGVLVLLSYSLSGLTASVLKRFVFEESLRPINVLDVSRLTFTEGVEVHGTMSFPSGHTATAFALFFCLSLMTKNRYVALLFFVLAFLVGLSRMYLLQHFFADTYAGALLGVMSVVISVLILNKFPALKKKKWLDLPDFLR